MVFRHAGGIAAVVSAPHRLLVYRPVRRAPPHQSTLCIFLKIGNLFPLISQGRALSTNHVHDGQERQARKARQVRARAGGGLVVTIPTRSLSPGRGQESLACVRAIAGTVV